MTFGDGVLRTTFDPEYRLCGLDLSDPRIGEAGLELTLAALDTLRTRTTAADAELVVVLIPTKELVFSGHVARLAPEEASRLAPILENEERARAVIRAFLDERGVRYVDPLEALEDCVERGIQPYGSGLASHPNPTGHEVIARVVETAGVTR